MGRTPEHRRIRGVGDDGRTAWLVVHGDDDRVYVSIEDRRITLDRGATGRLYAAIGREEWRLATGHYWADWTGNR